MLITHGLWFVLLMIRIVLILLFQKTKKQKLNILRIVINLLDCSPDEDLGVWTWLSLAAANYCLTR